MSATSSRTQRSRNSISPQRSRKSPVVSSPAPPLSKNGARPKSPSVSRPPSSKHQVSPASSISPSTASLVPTDLSKAKENVTVTVRFRPLSGREINNGDEIAWYADGDGTVRNEFNPSVSYGFDKVFGPATTTRHVYDVAAQHVVSGAMEGINGTVFAYGVTSSGKTHTMHGEQKSPGIIPLAVKDVFSIIQETPGREFLLRVSYLEIYNEVINDLLDPTGQNLRIREDAQGTYVEGIKEEVVLSPAHALSLIASGEEHRHVGSNNFNLLSSRSHTIFTLTIEGSSRTDNQGEEDVTLSQLNLIDLAGSESSKTETSGLRRKEGSYINKSLLTLGTVISKLTDGKATHVPYRDSKLTRLLQSSLSGHGQISLICTVTPASSSSEETHNTLKFAHRSKRVEIKASQNKILDEKSIIKKYQREISNLKEELQQLKRGMMEKPYLIASSETSQDDLVNLKLQLEAGQVKLQSRLEEEEQAKAALMGRIQRLTKLILVSTKTSISSGVPEKAGHRRRHSFAEDELAYLPDRKREYMLDDDTVSLDSEFSAEGRCDFNNLEELAKEDRKIRRRGMLGWFKLRKPEHLSGLSPRAGSETSASGSPASPQPLQQKFPQNDLKGGRRKSVSRRGDEHLIVDPFPEKTQAGELFSATARGCLLPPTGCTITDQMDLLREQVKMLAGEVAFCTSSLKRLSEQAASNPEDLNLQEHMLKLKDEISEKKLQMRILEQRMISSIEATPNALNSVEMSQALSKLTTQLNENLFELEIKSADNRILQEQLRMKNSEKAEMQETILSLREQLNSLLNKGPCHGKQISDSEATTAHGNCSVESSHNDGFGSHEETVDEKSPAGTASSNGMSFQEDSRRCKRDMSLDAQVLVQAAEIENLKQEHVILNEEKDGLKIHCEKLAEEALYAKELAAAAAVELKNLAEEVTRISYQNAKLTEDLAAAKDACCRSSGCDRHKPQDPNNGTQLESCLRKPDHGVMVEKLQKELFEKGQREALLESELSEREYRENKLQKRLEEARRHEEDLENELANMWVLVAKMKKSGSHSEETSAEGAHASDISHSTMDNGCRLSNGHSGKMFKSVETCRDKDESNALEGLRIGYEREKKRCRELESIISRLKSEDLVGLDTNALEELQNFHVEAITKICHAKFADHVL